MEINIVVNFVSEEIEIEGDNQIEEENEDQDINDNRENIIEEDEDDNDFLLPNESQGNIIIKYNKQNFKLYDIIDKFKKLKIIKDKIQCPNCNNNMILKEIKNYKDKLYQRCKKNGINKQDYKINLRNGIYWKKLKLIYEYYIF